MMDKWTDPQRRSLQVESEKPLVKNIIIKEKRVKVHKCSSEPWVMSDCRNDGPHLMVWHFTHLPALLLWDSYLSPREKDLHSSIKEYIKTKSCFTEICQSLKVQGKSKYWFQWDYTEISPHGNGITHSAGIHTFGEGTFTSLLPLLQSVVQNIITIPWTGIGKTGRGDMVFTMICQVMPFLGKTQTKWWGIEGGCKAPLVRIGSRETTKQGFGLLSLHAYCTRTMLSPQNITPIFPSSRTFLKGQTRFPSVSPAIWFHILPLY